MQINEQVEPDFEGWANKIKQFGLVTPVLMFLEINKPLSFSLSQFLLLGQPFLNVFLPGQFTYNIIDFFANPPQQEALMKQLEKG